MSDIVLDRLRRLPCWSGPIEVGPLAGGLGNATYLVSHGRRQSVARPGGDNPDLGAVRSLELAAHRAAHEEGLAPAILHAESDILVVDYIPGRILTPDDLATPDTLAHVLTILKRCHLGAAARFRGPAIARWPFLTIRGYGARLADPAGDPPAALSGWLDLADRIEPVAGAMRPTLIHSDPTAGNWIDDGERLWLIDWEYAGFADPLVDLAGVAANCGDRLDVDRLLHGQTGLRPGDGLKRRFAALVAAIVLRDAMWCLLASRQGFTAPGLDTLARQGFARFDDMCRRLGVGPPHS